MVFAKHFRLRMLSLQLPSDIQWHFIGPLQSNKAKLVVSTPLCVFTLVIFGVRSLSTYADTVTGVPNLFVVETVHSEKIATALEKACVAISRAQLRVFVQINTSGEDSALCSLL